MQTRGVRGQKIPKNANVICERPLACMTKRWQTDKNKASYECRFILIHCGQIWLKKSQNKTGIFIPFRIMVIKWYIWCSLFDARWKLNVLSKYKSRWSDFKLRSFFTNFEHYNSDILKGHKNMKLSSTWFDIF